MEQRKTARGHNHAEAFCLMLYACAGTFVQSDDPIAAMKQNGGRLARQNACGHRETFWNSRDGVTPFAMPCPSCGGGDLSHGDFRDDIFAPNHKPHFGQGIWRDGTPDEAEAIMRSRIAAFIEHARMKGDNAGVERYTEARIAALVEQARNPQPGEYGEFQKGWPMFARHGFGGMQR